MATYIKRLHVELLEIRKYLIKIGPSRRLGVISKKKLSEAKIILEKYNNYIENELNVELLEKVEIDIIENYCRELESLYKEICSLCQCSGSSQYIEKMDQFDLKVALNLLPVMNDEYTNTQQLINGIEYYSSIIEEQSHTQLISFVLKTRLSQSARLKLATKYETVLQLIDGMKKALLPKKSACALQKQFLNCKQNELSIDDFGKTLSEMFVNLTMSQAEGDTEKFNVLKSVNEKQAIRQFSDGLRNRRISTIISAQRFENLKDAIQAAVDEDISFSGPTEVLTMRHNNKRNFHNNFRHPQYQYHQRGVYNAGRGRGGRSWQQIQGDTRPWFQHSQSRPRATRGRTPYRGNGGFNNNYRGRKQYQGHVRVFNQDLQPEASTSEQNKASENEFFRI